MQHLLEGETSFLVCLAQYGKTGLHIIGPFHGLLQAETTELPEIASHTCWNILYCTSEKQITKTAIGKRHLYHPSTPISVKATCTCIRVHVVRRAKYTFKKN